MTDDQDTQISEFDKFMDRILLEEGQLKEKPRDEATEDEDPRRKLNRLYTERANNRIRYVRK